MTGKARLEPGWLTRDVNDAASRAKALEAQAPPKENPPGSSASAKPAPDAPEKSA